MKHFKCFLFHGWNYFKCAYKSFFQYIDINTCMYFDQPFSFQKKTLLGTAYLKPATLQKHFLLLDILTILNSVTCSNYTQSSECAKVYSCIHLTWMLQRRSVSWQSSTKAFYFLDKWNISYHLFLKIDC